MSILQFVPKPIAAAFSEGEHAEAGKQFVSDPPAASFQARKAILVDELRHFLHRKNALMKEVERQFVNELHLAASLLASQSRATNNEKIEHLTIVGERATALERLMSRLHFLSEQKVEETKYHLRLLYNQPLDIPDAHTLGPSGELASSAKQNVTSGSLLAWLVDNEITESSVTYVDLTNVFDRCYDSLSVDMN